MAVSFLPSLIYNGYHAFPYGYDKHYKQQILYPLKLLPCTNGEIIRERYRTGFPAAGDIIFRERHTEPVGMVYSRFFSA